MCGFGKGEEESPGVGASGKRKAALPTLALRLDAYVKKGAGKHLLAGAETLSHVSSYTSSFFLFYILYHPNLPPTTDNHNPNYLT